MGRAAETAREVWRNGKADAEKEKGTEGEKNEADLFRDTTIRTGEDL